MTLIAIDGPAGAGKTTLAAKMMTELALYNSINLIHMDDLYSGWSNPLNEDLSLTLSRIVEAFASQKEFTVSIFNWSTNAFDSSLTFEPSEILIIEGVGAGQKTVRDAGAILYWLDVEPEIGLARVLNRDGFDIQTQMRQWQVDQDEHFERDATRTFANHILTS
ncbi:unannotated protein [freshwater metagenome]|uniref:Unannotated protein n=1 Tax=freshwater metagenome TaxID=449393 RepID=A0A6J7I2J5_9ZZZZ|nr:hypothetical protein [Actinomycetota bacterium]